MAKRWGCLPIATLSLFALPYIVHADSVHSSQADLGATSLAVASVVGPTGIIATPRSPRKVHMRHGPQSRMISIDAAHHEDFPTLISENLGTRTNLPSGMYCSGTWAWSLLCPDAQVIGISY
jgi:hypothetical protein